MNLLVLGPQGSGKGTQAKRTRGGAGSRTSRPATCSARRSRRGPRSAAQVEPILAGGELVPDELTIALIRERLSEPDATRRLRARRLPAEPRAGRGARRDARRDRPRPRRRPLLRPRPTTSLDERLRRRAVDEGRDDDTPEVIDRRLRAVPRADRAGRRALPRDRQARPAPRRALDRRGRDRDRRGARPARGARGVIIRKGAAEIDRIARAGDVVAETIAHVGEQLEPGDHAARARPDRRRVHPRPRRHPDLAGLQGLPARDLHLRQRRRRPRDPGRYVVEEGDIVTIDVGVTLDGAIADSAYTFGGRRDRRRVAAAARRLPGRARRRHRGGAARQPDRRHLARRPDGRRGGRLLRREEPRRARRGAPLPRGPARPELRRPGRGPKLSEGMTIAIEPMITVGRPGRRGSPTTTGRSRPRTARGRRISSTRSRSTATARGS